MLYNNDRTVFEGLAACGGDPSVVFKQVFVEIDIDRTARFVNITLFLYVQ